jgi:hypothetical protein
MTREALFMEKWHDAADKQEFGLLIGRRGWG